MSEATLALPTGTPAEAARAHLKGQTINGVAINLAAQLARFALQFLSGIVMARLLDPADFGLVAMTAPVIALVQLFADLGLSQAAIQMTDISQAQLSFLFWVNVAVSLALALLLAAAAPLVGWFYHDHRVVGLAMAFAALLVVGGCYSQHMAMLARQLRFGHAAIINLASIALGIVAGIAAALLGAGYWSLLIAQAAASLTTLVLAWSITGWRPGRPASTSDIRALLRFGGNMTSFNLLDFLSRNTATILIGRFLGERSLGFYDRAYKLVLLPFNQVATPFTNVALPLLSRTQSDVPFYRQAFQRMLESILLLTYPGLAYAWVVSGPLIAHVLGPRWSGAAPVFAVLVIDAFVAPIGNAMGWLFVSQGRTRQMRNWGALGSALFVAAFAIGLRWGVVGVATGYVVAGITEIAFLTQVGTRTGPLRGRDLWQAVYPALFAAACTILLLGAALRHRTIGWPTLIVAAIAAYAIFGAALLTLPAGRASLRAVLQQLRPYLRRLNPRRFAHQ